MDKRERAGSSSSAELLMRDLANPGMYAPSAFPRPKQDNGVAMVPKVSQPGQTEANGEAQPDLGEGTASILGEGAGDDEATRRGRASQALAEMKSAAQQRGLLKSSGESESRNSTCSAMVSESAEAPAVKPANEIAAEKSAVENLKRELKSTLDAKANATTEKGSVRHKTGTGADREEGTETNGTSGSKQIDDAPRCQRLVVLLDWLTNSIGMSEVFLIDSCGYSLLAEKADPSTGDAASALHDLGLRMGGILDLAGRRLMKGASANESDSGGPGRVARLTLDENRCLAVAKVAMTHGAGRPLLGWVEVPGQALADSWVETACDYTAEVLAHDFMS